jgi:hypothetical protein
MQELSKSQSYTLKKKLTKIANSLKVNTLILLISTILIMAMTNSVSNLIILLGMFLNFPLYKDTKFRVFLMLGLSLGIIIEPQQLLYFVLAIVMLYVRGQDY